MRVSDSSLMRQFLTALLAGKEQVSRSLDQLADGKKVRFASDDPSGARTALALRGRLARTEGFRRSTESARFELSTIETRLSEAYDRMVTIQEDAMAGASSVTINFSGETLASKVEEIRAELLSLANTRQNGRYLFGGTETLGEPFDGNGLYVGNTDEVQAPLDRSETIGATLDGSRAFQGDGDVFATLDALAAAFRAQDDDAIRALLPEIDAELKNFNTIRAEVGTRLERIDRKLFDVETEQFQLQARIAEIENIEIEQVAVELASAETSLNSISTVAANVLGRSLFDYLG